LAEVLMPEGNSFAATVSQYFSIDEKNGVSGAAHFMRADAVDGFAHTFSFNADDAACISLCAR
jgi:hypothetical protein